MSKTQPVFNEKMRKVDPLLAAEDTNALFQAFHERRNHMDPLRLLKGQSLPPNISPHKPILVNTLPFYLTNVFGPLGFVRSAAIDIWMTGASGRDLAEAIYLENNLLRNEISSIFIFIWLIALGVYLVFGSPLSLMGMCLMIVWTGCCLFTPIQVIRTPGSDTSLKLLEHIFQTPDNAWDRFRHEHFPMIFLSLKILFWMSLLIFLAIWGAAQFERWVNSQPYKSNPFMIKIIIEWPCHVISIVLLFSLSLIIEINRRWPRPNRCEKIRARFDRINELYPQFMERFVFEEYSNHQAKATASHGQTLVRN